MIIGGIKVQKLSYNDTQHFFRGCRLNIVIPIAKQRSNT